MNILSMTKPQIAVFYHDVLGWTDKRIGAVMGVSHETIGRWRHKEAACPIARLSNGRAHSLLVGTMFCAECPGHIPAGCPGNCQPAKGRFDSCWLSDECSCTKHDPIVIAAGKVWWERKLAEHKRVEREHERLERARTEYA